jgi:Mor family transcriptional regulator
MKRSHNSNIENLPIYEQEFLSLYYNDMYEVLLRLFLMRQNRQPIDTVLSLLKILDRHYKADLENNDPMLAGDLPVEEDLLEFVLDIAKNMTDSKIQKKEVENALKIAARRSYCSQYKKMGGRTSRINSILFDLREYPIFSDKWQWNVKMVEQQYAKSTVMKALKILLN